MVNEKYYIFLTSKPNSIFTMNIIFFFGINLISNQEIEINMVH